MFQSSKMGGLAIGQRMWQRLHSLALLALSATPICAAGGANLPTDAVLPGCAQHVRLSANGMTTATMPVTRQNAPKAITLTNNSPQAARVRVWTNSVPDVSSYDKILELVRSRSDSTTMSVAFAASDVVSRFRSQNALPANPGDECHDPVKLFNSYGYGLCDDAARVSAHLLNGFGFTTSIWDLSFHVVTEFGDGETTGMLDADLNIVAMDPETSRALSVREALWMPEKLVARGQDPSSQVPEARQEFRDKIAGLYADRRTSATAAYVHTGATHDASIVLRAGETMTRYRDARMGFYSSDSAAPPPPRYGNAVFEWRTEFPKTAPDGMTDYDTETKLPFVLVSGEIELRSEVMPTAYDAVEVTTDSRNWIAIRPTSSRMMANVLVERYTLPQEVRGAYQITVRLRPSEFCDQIDAPVQYFQRLVTQSSPTTFPDLDESDIEPQLMVEVDGEGAIDVTYSWDCEIPEVPASSFPWEHNAFESLDRADELEIPVMPDPA